MKEMHLLLADLRATRDSLAMMPGSGSIHLELMLEAIVVTLQELSHAKVKLSNSEKDELAQLVGQIEALATNAGQFYGSWRERLDSYCNGYSSLGTPQACTIEPSHVCVHG